MRRRRIRYSASTRQLVADDVYYFTGGTHHSVIVNFNDYVVVIEAPLDEARSSAVISEVKKLYFNKPIRYLVNTHAHFDHAGGIRTYAAEGATILTYQMNKPYYEKTFAMPRTLAPDKLSAVEEEGRHRSGGREAGADRWHAHDRALSCAERAQRRHADRLSSEREDRGGGGSLYAGRGRRAARRIRPSPYTVSLVENLDSLKLDYDKILGLHGRLATKEELMKAVGRAPAVKRATRNR